MQESEVELLIGQLIEGRLVHTDVAIFTSVSDSQCHLSLSVRIDKRIDAALNNPGGFTGKISNKANIGMTSQEVAAI